MKRSEPAPMAVRYIQSLDAVMAGDSRAAERNDMDIHDQRRTGPKCSRLRWLIGGRKLPRVYAGFEPRDS